MNRLINWIKEIFGAKEEEAIKEKKIAIVEYGEDETVERYIGKKLEIDANIDWYYYDESLGIEGLMVEIGDLSPHYDIVIVYPARPNLVDWERLKQWSNVGLFPFADFMTK